MAARSKYHEEVADLYRKGTAPGTVPVPVQTFGDPNVVSLPEQRIGMSDVQLPEQTIANDNPYQFDPMAGLREDRNARILADAEAQSAHNTEWERAKREGRINSLGQILPSDGPLRGGIAPPQPEANGPMVPVRNSLGQVIRYEHAGAPILQNPFAASSHEAPPAEPVATTLSGQPEEIDPAKGHFSTASGQRGAPGGAGIGNGGAGGVAGGSASMSLSEAGGGGADWNSPYYTQAGGAAAKGLAQQEEFEARSAGAQKSADYLAEEGDAQKSRAAERDKIAGDYMAKIEAMNADVASQKVDPDHWWNSRSTGQQIMFVLGAALSGFSAGFRGGGPNQVLAMGEHAINADIEAQKENILNGHRGVEHEKGLLAEMYRRFGNMEQAELAAKQIALDHMKAETDAMIAQAGGHGALADATMVQGALDEKRQENIERANEFATKMAVSLAEHRGKGGGKGGASDKEVEAYQKELEAHNIPALLEALNGAEASAGSTNAAGLNPVSMKAGWDPRSDARQNIQMANDVMEMYSKSLGRVSASNVKELKSLLSTGDEKDVKRAYGMIRHNVNAHIRSISAGRPAAAVTYWGRVGGYGSGGTPQNDNGAGGVQVMPMTGTK